MSIGENNTNIVLGTTAEYAYNLYLAKKRQIEKLEYECGLLVDKYHSEMCGAHMPFLFDEKMLVDLFSEDENSRTFVRQNFLEFCFSPEFLAKFKVDFVEKVFHGYSHTAINVVMSIGDYEYSVEIPQPRNILSDEEKNTLMGRVQFRADKIHKSKKNESCKMWESVQMPTYDWKKCFEAIEADVMVEFVKGNEKKS